jgi:hypothetical protein
MVGMKTLLITVGGIMAGATIGGLCGYQINARNWGAIKDPESLWAWATIIGGSIGAVVPIAVLAIKGMLGGTKKP